MTPEQTRAVNQAYSLLIRMKNIREERERQETGVAALRAWIKQRNRENWA